MHTCKRRWAAFTSIKQLQLSGFGSGLTGTIPEEWLNYQFVSLEYLAIGKYAALLYFVCAWPGFKTSHGTVIGMVMHGVRRCLVRGVPTTPEFVRDHLSH